MASSTWTTSSVQTNRASKALDICVYFIVFLLMVNIYNDHFGITSITCSAGPMPISLVLPPSSSSVDAPTIRVVNLTRQHGGDTFTAFGKLLVNFFVLFFHLVLIVLLPIIFKSFLSFAVPFSWQFFNLKCLNLNRFAWFHLGGRTLNCFWWYWWWWSY